MMYTVWCNYRGKFVDDTGYYVHVSCNQCQRRALVLTGNVYLCGEHLTPDLSIPDWLEARREGGHLYV